MNSKPMLPFVIEELAKRKGDWRKIAADSGVPYSTLCKIAQGHTKDPGVSQVQMLYDHIVGSPQKAAA